MAITPGPWRWVTDGSGPNDEWGTATPGPIDPHKFKSKGHYENPQLFGAGALDDYDNRIISGGGGEYNPFNRPEDAVAIAAVPELIAALTDALDTMDGIGVFSVGSIKTVIEKSCARARAALAKAEGKNLEAIPS